MLASLVALATLVAPVPVAGGPVPEHTVVAFLRDYMPSSSIAIKQGESI
jgi:hypothetical protein